MLAEDKVNGEARCFLCTKDKLNGYNFEEEDYLSLILSKKTINENEKSHHPLKTPTRVLKNLKVDTQELIKPCKCGLYAHVPCLIQYCLLHLTYKCEECQSDYNFHFNNIVDNTNSCEKIKFGFQIGFAVLFHLILFGVTGYFWAGKTFKDEFSYWHYVIGIAVLMFNVATGVSTIFLFKKKSSILHSIYPVFETYVDGKKKTDLDYHKMGVFFKQILNSNTCELMEKKMNSRIYITTTLNPQRGINKFIVNNNNNMFDQDSERFQDELRNEDMEKKFHGHQIIKSTLVQRGQDALGGLLSKKKTIENKMLTKSRTKNQGSKKVVAIPRFSVNMPKILNNIQGKEGSGKDLTINEINSKGKLLENPVSINVGKQGDGNEPPSVEEQLVKHMAMMKKEKKEKEVLLINN